MANTTERGITYPTSGDNIAPLETHFATLATSTDTAITEAISNIDASNITSGTLAIAKGGTGADTAAEALAALGGLPSSINVAGKNKIINGDFEINQRAFTSTTSIAYGFDRWVPAFVGGTNTYSAQTFSPGTAPEAGYEARNFARMVTSGQSAVGDYSLFLQRIEDVRTLAGQTATISFWAKAGSGTPKVSVELEQSFGSGGSPSTAVDTYAGQVTLSTSWARYSVTVNVPSISGKTIGSTANSSSLALIFWLSGGSTWNSRSNSIGIQSNTFDFWGVQVERGSVATPFSRAAGTLQGELAACQRYYFIGGNGVFGIMNNTTTCRFSIQYPVAMRIAPTVKTIATTTALNPTVAENQTSSIATGTTISAVMSGSIGTKAASKLEINGWASGADGRMMTMLTDSLEFNAEL